MAIQLKRKCHHWQLHELIDEGRFQPLLSDSLNGYDGGMNFLGVLGEVPNHQLHDRDVVISCEWSGKISPPLHHEAGRPYEPNILYDYNGSGFHFPNNDPRYILPIGSKGLVLNKVDFLKEDSEIEFWRIRQTFLASIYIKFLSHKLLTKWANKKTADLNNELKASPKIISVG